jgi:glycosyltransferase involved in cell wall biosynthesis
VERRYLQRAACLHALVPSELEDIRRFGITAPVAVVPNGIDLTPFDHPQTSELAFDGRPHPGPVAIFLSRIHPKKGLTLLLRAWSRLGRGADGWLLIVAGPDEDGHRRQLELQAVDLGLGDRVLFCGPLYGPDKLQLLTSAELFILPSRSEGFSVAVLEAMAARTPVLITDKCNFDEVQVSGAGEVTECSVEAIASGLNRLLQLSRDQRREMGLRARRLVEAKYTWEQVVVEMESVYQWVISGGAPPACVDLISDRFRQDFATSLRPTVRNAS